MTATRSISIAGADLTKPGAPGAGAGAAARRQAAGFGRAVLPPLVLGVLALIAWQLLVVLADIKPYLLPSPTAIGEQIGEIFPMLVSSTLATGTNAFIGLLGGAIVAIVAALLASRLPVVDRMLVPIVAAVAVVPIVALAPVLNTMYGSTSETPRRLVVAIVVFAPIFINTLRGLRQVLPVHRDLMKAYAASPWQVTKTVTLPGALPFLFTGLRIASSLGVISALVAEYFGGLQNGLGARITSAASNSAYPRAWAYVFGAIILGLVFYGVTLLLERIVQRRLSPQKRG
jgi:NitT/TauT family transport system permease protein